MKKLLLAIAAVAVAQGAGAQVRVPSYVELNLTDIISNGYIHGNTVMADVNNDGNLELIVKGRDLNNGWATGIKYLSGDGYSFSQATDIADDGCSWERIVYPIDYNCDGNIDLILGSSWGSKLLKGDGTGNFTMVEEDLFKLEGEINIEEGDGKSDKEKWYTSLMAIADFNGDGYPDIVTFCGNPREDAGEPILFINNGGTGEFTKQFGVGLLPQRGGTMAVGDFNKDGYPDLAVSGWNDDFSNDCIRVYANDGKATFTEVASETFNNAKAGTETGQIFFVDVDGDGWLDLFVSGQSCPQGWKKLANVYRNVDGKNFEEYSTTLPGINGGGGDWADLNGDGLMDFIYAGESDNGAKTIVVINEGNGVLTAHEDLTPGHRGGAQVTVGDFNNNGIPDFTVMGYNDAGVPHFSVLNGVLSRGKFEAPAAPSNLVSTSADGKTTFSWNAATDDATPAAALRYNVVVKTNDGKIFSMVPADIATGKLRCGDVNAATTATTRTLNISSENIQDWAVQTIDGTKMASPLVWASSMTGIVNTLAAAPSVRYENGVLTTGADAVLTVVAMDGSKVMQTNVAANTPCELGLSNGIYAAIVDADGVRNTVKIIVK